MDALAVTEAGTPGRPAIVFLHGSGTTARMWTRHLPSFHDYHDFAPDLPGHGDSGQLQWRSLADAAERVAELIRTRAVGRQANVVGLSLGGEVGYVLLARYPDLIRRAVIDGAAVVPSRVAPLLKLGVAVVSPFVHYRPVMRALARTVGVPPAELGSFQSELRRVPTRTFRRAFADAQDPGVVTDVLRSTVPTLLVTGERELVDMHMANAALEAHRPHTTARVVPAMGHGWLASKPDLHARMVRAWIEDQALPVELRPETDAWRTTHPGRRIEQTAEHLGLA
jgi:pimeloyl-ACP methyl ester carboxylesterase